jgi:hypothetical protein
VKDINLVLGPLLGLGRWTAQSLHFVRIVQESSTTDANKDNGSSIDPTALKFGLSDINFVVVPGCGLVTGRPRALM